MLARVLELRPGDSNLVSVLTDLREFLLTRMVASNMRPGDEVFVADSGDTAKQREVLAILTRIDYGMYS